MDKKLLVTLVAILTLLSSVNFALAAGKLSVASISIPSSANHGDSFTLSASISGSSVTSVSGTLNLPSGITCTPTGSQSISLSSTGTGTGSWSCKGDVAGDYTNKITVSLSGKDSSPDASGGDVSGSQQTGLKVLSPASLSASSTTKSGSVIFTVGVNNAGDLDSSYTVSTSCGSATCTAPSGSQTISSNSVKTHDITVSGSAGTYTVSATVTGNGQSLTTSQSLTIAAEQATPTPTPTSTPGTVPGTKVTVQKGKATITIPSIAAGKQATVDITKTEDVAFRKIIISVANAVNNIQVTVTKLDAKPASITQEISGKVFHYIQVDKNVTETAVNQSIIRFEVNKTWITDNNVNKSDIALFRYTDKWNKLQTSEISDVNQTVLYEAISPGLSVFAIAAETPSAAPTPTPTPTPTPGETPPAAEEGAPTAAKGRAGLWITIIILVVAAAGVVFFLVKKNIIKLGSIVPKKSSGWDDLKKKYSKR